MKYTTMKFVTLQSLQQNPPKPGQWVFVDGQIRGQYLGKTRAGDIVVRYQRDKFGSRADTMSNHYLRQFAIVNGSK